VEVTSTSWVWIKVCGVAVDAGPQALSARIEAINTNMEIYKFLRISVLLVILDEGILPAHV
jgi:hypothetical protein